MASATLCQQLFSIFEIFFCRCFRPSAIAAQLRFLNRSATQPVQNTKAVSLCQHVFSLFLKFLFDPLLSAPTGGSSGRVIPCASMAEPAFARQRNRDCGAGGLASCEYFPARAGSTRFVPQSTLSQPSPGLLVLIARRLQDDSHGKQDYSCRFPDSEPRSTFHPMNMAGFHGYRARIHHENVDYLISKPNQHGTPVRLYPRLWTVRAA